jgi:hypothetical protein
LRRASLKSTGGFGRGLHQAGLALSAAYPHGSATAIEKQAMQELPSNADVVSGSTPLPLLQMTEVSWSVPATQQEYSNCFLHPKTSVCCLIAQFLWPFFRVFASCPFIRIPDGQNGCSRSHRESSLHVTNTTYSGLQEHRIIVYTQCAIAPCLVDPMPALYMGFFFLLLTLASD